MISSDWQLEQTGVDRVAGRLAICAGSGFELNGLRSKDCLIFFPDDLNSDLARAGRDRNNKPDHLTAHDNRSGSTSLTVAGPSDEEFQGHANSCRSGSGPFGACALPDVFELWWPSALTFTEVFDTGKAPQ